MLINRLINRLIDTILTLDISGYLGTVIQVLIILIWIYIIRKFRLGYKRSLVIALYMLLTSIILLVFTFKGMAALMSEYAFIFLGIGILQLTFTKETS